MYAVASPNLEEAPPKKNKNIKKEYFLFLKHAYMFRRFKIFVKIYIYIYVFATFIFYHINFSHVPLKGIQKGPNLIPISSLRNMSVIDQNMLVTRKLQMLGDFLPKDTYMKSE